MGSITDSVSSLELVCPTHNRALSCAGRELACPAGESFQVQNGIARFTSGSKYTATFGAQWKKYRLTQLDSYSGTTITADRLRRCLGEELWRQLSGKRVLECGCGAGRFTEVLLQHGSLVTSVDLSEAVEANQDTFPQSPAHRIIQADITRLPFPLQRFDFVLCLGVVQHTPNPEHTIASIYQHVAPGGWLVIDHYTYRLAEFTKLAYMLRPLMKRLSPEKGIHWTERMTNTFLPLHKMARRQRWLHMILSRISPVLCYYHTYPQIADSLQKEWAFLDTHDWLTCWYRHHRTRRQIERTLGELGMHNIHAVYGGNGVEARGQRPQSSIANT